MAEDPKDEEAEVAAMLDLTKKVSISSSPSFWDCVRRSPPHSKSPPY